MSSMAAQETAKPISKRLLGWEVTWEQLQFVF